MAQTDSEIIQECKCSKQADADLEQVRNIVQAYQNHRSPLIMVLHDVQRKFGYLPEHALQVVSENLGISMADIYGVATFYSLFSLEPKGKHVIRVCLGTACYVKGSQEILERLEKELQIKVGETSADGKVTLEATRCLGACGLAPVVAAEDKVHGKVTDDELPEILQSCQ